MAKRIFKFHIKYFKNPSRNCIFIKEKQQVSLLWDEFYQLRSFNWQHKHGGVSVHVYKHKHIYLCTHIHVHIIFPVRKLSKVSQSIKFSQAKAARGILLPCACTLSHQPWLFTFKNTCMVVFSYPSWKVNKIETHYSPSTDQVTSSRGLETYLQPHNPCAAISPQIWICNTAWNQLFRFGEKPLGNYSVQNPLF